jgi:hypothetical protein
MQSWADFRLVAPPQKVVQQSSGKWEVLPQQPGSLWCFPLFGRRHDQQSDRLLTSFPVCKATGATKPRLCLTGKVNIQNPCSGYVVWQSPWTMFLNFLPTYKNVPAVQTSFGLSVSISEDESRVELFLREWQHAPSWPVELHASA